MPIRSLPRTTGRYVITCVAAAALFGALANPGAGAAPAGSPGSASSGDPEGSDPGSGPSTSGTTATTAPQTSGTGDEKAAAEASVESLQVERSAVRAQLAEATTARNQQYDEWSLRHLAAGAAVIEAQRAVEALDAARLAVVAAEERVKEYATEAFINPPMFEKQAVLSIRDADDMSWAHDLLTITADDQRRVLAELEAAREAAREAAQAAERASAQAAELEASEKSKLDELEAAVSRQTQLAAQVESRLDSAMAEVAALEAVDSQAARELAEAEGALAEEVRSSVAGTSQQQANAATKPSRQRSAGPSTGTTAPRTPRATAPAAPRPVSPPSGSVTWSDVTKVGGIWVNRSIAGNVRALLDAASSAGVNLSGGGFRDPAEQIALRRAHCGPSHYDIYEKPASQCTPPTAVPGRSMHERGLAIDFKYNGALITSRSNPGYQWLAANAAGFGLYNLPSEPWHWSTNGN